MFCCSSTRSGRCPVVQHQVVQWIRSCASGVSFLAMWGAGLSCRGQVQVVFPASGGDGRVTR
ncbi:unnamed protein product [Tetraodon nigroviridis]|uniref:(spotted green pufferfish) hypothetical protein n=1 Tax=Tetraodon nigroviridis TaxID=99883 RepID=Q4SX62_TETNG|nr:unnamed protein product [Tetraodon nigroviridis]